jgi:alpha-galactosidase
VPLWRSDDNGPALDEQCHTYGIAFWLPYYGSGIAFGGNAAPNDVYTLRSGMLPSYMVLLEVADSLDPAIVQAMASMREWHAFAGDLFGDYYPLTPYSIDTSVWIAWQFNRPNAGTGVVQAFRRDTSTVDMTRFKLRGLDANASYELRNFDSKDRIHAKGRELMATGLPVRLGAPASAATITYTRVMPG